MKKNFGFELVVKPNASLMKNVWATDKGGQQWSMK